MAYGGWWQHLLVCMCYDSMQIEITLGNMWESQFTDNSIVVSRYLVLKSVLVHIDYSSLQLDGFTVLDLSICLTF